MDKQDLKVQMASIRFDFNENGLNVVTLNGAFARVLSSGVVDDYDRISATINNFEVDKNIKAMLSDQTCLALIDALKDKVIADRFSRAAAIPPPGV